MECLKFMKDVFTITFLLMLKQYYQVSYQLIKNPIFQIMSSRKNRETINILWVLFLWISPRLLTVFLLYLSIVATQYKTRQRRARCAGAQVRFNVGKGA